jgi:hypothetical protein
VNSDWTHVPVPNGLVLFGPWGDVASDGKAMFFVWTDARNGDADVYSRTVWRSMTILSSTPTAVTTHAGGVVHVQVTVQNLDDLFDWNLLLRGTTLARSWPNQDMNVTLGAGATTTYDFVLTVPDTAAPGTLTYNVEARSSNATFDYFGSAPLALTIVPPSGVEAEAPVLDLAPVAPNPASSQATLTFSLSRKGPVRLAVFDVSGRLVRRLDDGELSAGPHTRVWNGADESGGRVRSGAYFVQLEAEGKRLHRRLVWVR